MATVSLLTLLYYLCYNSSKYNAAVFSYLYIECNLRNYEHWL